MILHCKIIVCQTHEDSIITTAHNYNSIFKIKMKSTYTGIDSFHQGIVFYKMKQLNTLGEIKFEYIGYKDSIVYRIYQQGDTILKSYPLYLIIDNGVYTNFDENGKTDFKIDSTSCSVSVNKVIKNELIKLTSIDQSQTIYVQPGYGWVAVALDQNIIWWDVDFFK